MSKRVQVDNITTSIQVSPQTSLQNYRRIIELVCSNHKGVPYFDATHGLLRRGKYLEMVHLADYLSKQSYTTVPEHFRANQLSLLIRKYPWPDLNIRKDEVALETFRRSEHKCKRVNAKFRALQKRSPEEAFLNRMRKWISYVIGEEPDVGKVLHLSGYGPGSNVALSGKATHEARKFLAAKCTATAGAVSFARAAGKIDPEYFEYILRSAKGCLHGSYTDSFRLVDVRPWLEFVEGVPLEHCGPRFTQYLKPVSWDTETFDREFDKRLKIVDYNKIALVPKTVLTDRTVGAEPLWNSFLQMGVGEVLALLLKRVGLDITDQSRNGHMAYVGSLFGHLATIDLSSASDTIATELCRFLLPPAWFDLLNSLRSKYYRLPGSNISKRYEKFTSMGNGFCFPLETLLFAAVCEAATQEVSGSSDSYSTYGDDIIVPTEIAPRVLQMLKYCGFTPNLRKTFTSGSFRESCGQDWFAGFNVRPITVDNQLEAYTDYFCLHNLIVRETRFSEFFAGVPALIRSMVPPSFRFVRPVRGVIDSAFEVSQDVFLASKFACWRRETFSWRWKELKCRAVKDRSFDEVPGYSQALMRSAMHGSSSASPFQLRRETEAKVGKVAHWGIREDTPAPAVFYGIAGHCVQQYAV